MSYAGFWKCCHANLLQTSLANVNGCSGSMEAESGKRMVISSEPCVCPAIEAESGKRMIISSEPCVCPAIEAESGKRMIISSEPTYPSCKGSIV